jgi:O-antigen/teichoic acid export membrane protein
MTTAPPLDPRAAGASPAAGAAAPSTPVDRAVEAGRGALFIGAAKAVFMVSGFLQQVLLARLVSVAGMGAFGAVNSVVSFVNNTIVQATIQSVSKFTAEDDSRAELVKRAALQVQVIFGLVIALAFFLGAPLLAGFVKAPDYANYFRIVAAIPMLYAVYSVFIGSVNGLRRFRVQAGFDMAFSASKTVLLLGCAAFAGVGGAFAGFALAALLILVVATRVVGLPRPLQGPRFDLGRLLPFMLAVIPYNAFLNGALLYDLPLLHHFAAAVDSDRGRIVAGHYQALRTLALLPYQFLLVVTFVIFPLVSRSTFVADREATRAYVTQTLRYALILAAGMGLTLAARPSALLGTFFKPEYLEGAAALPILVGGECCLALLAISCSILNAAGRTRASLSLMALTVVTGVAAAYVLVPRAALGQEMLAAAAAATSCGMILGFVASVVYLRLRLGGNPPLATVARVAIAGGVVLVVGRFLPVGSKIVGLAATVIVAVLYFAVLIVLREFGPADRAKIRKILRRG